MSKTLPLCFKAGPGAFRYIAENGVQVESLGAIAGAAGGPKWLVLSAIDKLLFGNWLRQRQSPLPLVGSSIGSWRFAAVAQTDAVSAIDRLEQLYIEQRYSDKPDIAEVTRVARGVVQTLLGHHGAAEILSHPWARLHAVTARCKGWTARDRSIQLGTGFAAAVMLNGLSRQALSLFMQRDVFADPRTALSDSAFPGFDNRFVALNETNLESALLASGSIPFVLENISVNGIAGYRDGGLIDYHMDLPLESDRLVLMPHFSKTVIPGWLDKYVPWHRPRFMHNHLVIHPSDDWLHSLPNHKLPDRSDFHYYRQDYEGRLRDWRLASLRSQELADCLAERLQKQDWMDFLQAL